MDILNKTYIQNKILRAPEFGEEENGGGGTTPSSSSSSTINIGGVEVEKFYLGDSANVKIYLGDTLLYPQTQPSYKLIAQYNDTTEYKVECDGSSALTPSEVSGHTTAKSAMTSAEIGACSKDTFKIGDNAFYGCSAMTAITLDDNITEFGSQAFFGCSALTSFHFPSGLTSMGPSQFRLANGIREISGIPSGVTYLSSGCFADMLGLSAATIPATVTGGSTNVFLRDSNLKELHFEGTTPPAFGDNAFGSCTSLEKIYIPSCDSYDAYAANSNFSGYTDLIYAEDQTKCRGESYPFAFKREHNGGSAYTRSCSSSSADTITSAMTKSGTSISVITGTSKQVTAITVGDCTKRIDNGAFSGWTKVENIIISEDVQEIGDRAFYQCGKNASSRNCILKLGMGINKLGYYSFTYATSIKSIILPGKTINFTSANTFSYMQYLTGVTFNEGFNVTGNGESMFSNCVLRNVILPNSLTKVTNNMFYSNTLTALTIGNGVTTIGNNAFYGHKIKNLTIPDNVTSIGNSSFNSSAVDATSLIIGNGVTTIRTSGCSYDFERVDIGSGITRIDNYGLYNGSCKTLICRATTPPSCGTAAFGSWSSGGVSYPQIYVPDSSVNAYKNASFWTIHSDEIHPLSDLN